MEESKMTSIKRFARRIGCATGLLISTGAFAQIPTTDAPNQSDFQAEAHFLTFLGSYVPESVKSATAYYKAIDPTGSKVTFQQWLLNAGFISNVNQWHSSGKQLIACNLPGCDLPAGTYGDNIVNVDAHVIVLNAADLGFVRNQFIRCKPSCTARNPILYTYLENYPVNPFANSQTGGTGFPVLTGFPSDAEAAAAMISAITRPYGTLAGCVTADTGLGCSIARIADVAFEWAPPASNPKSTARFGTQYAYIFHVDSVTGAISETINWPDQPFLDKVFNNRLVGAFPSQFPPAEPVIAGQPFAPELDFRGVKQMPGVCLTCHGGNPKNLLSTGIYPRQGQIDGFRFLPIDVGNMKFSSDAGPEATSRASQEPQIKQYNKIVLMTVDQSREGDGTGTFRGPHLAEVIKGWYAGFVGDQNMTAPTQNTKFVPVGWAGHEAEYLNVVSTSCRTCHFNREISLDFGTYANFHQGSDMLQLALKPYCNAFTSHYSVDPNLRPMPLAGLSYKRYWGNATDPNGANLNADLPGTLAADFGFASTAAYCASNP
jgi:hypothetical protein